MSTTAQFLHRIIGRHTGEPFTRDVAAFLGMSRQQWSAYRNGRTSPREITVNGWLKACKRAGIDVPTTVCHAVRNA